MKSRNKSCPEDTQPKPFSGHTIRPQFQHWSGKTGITEAERIKQHQKMKEQRFKELIKDDRMEVSVQGELSSFSTNEFL